MPDDVRIGLGVDTDERSFKRAGALFSKLNKDIGSTSRAVQTQGALFSKATRDTDAQTKAIREQADAQKSLQSEINGTTAAQQRFLQTNAQGRLGSLFNGGAGGAKGKLNDPKFAQQLGAGIFNAPSLPLPGVQFGTDTIGRGLRFAGQAGVSLSTLGTALAVVAPLAIAGAVGFNRLSDSQKKAQEAQKAYNTSVRETIEALNEDRSIEGIQNRKQALEEELRVSQQAEQALRNVRDSRNEENNFIQDFFNSTRILTGGARKELNRGVREAEIETRKATTALEAYNDVIAQQSTLLGIVGIALSEANKELERRAEVALETAETSRQLAETQAQASQFGLASLQNAQRQLAELQGLEVAGAGEQAVQDRLQSIADERNAIQAQIDTLQQSGITTEAVTEKIAELNAQLALLGSQENIVRDSLSVAKARDNETRAIEGQIEAIQANERARETALAEAERARDRLASIEQDVLDKREDANIKALEQEFDLELDFKRDLAKISRDSVRDRLSLEKDLGRKRRDLAEAGDVFGLKQLSKDAQDRRADLREELTYERNERRIAQTQREQDLERSIKRQSDTIEREYGRALRNLSTTVQVEFARMSEGVNAEVRQFVSGVISEFARLNNANNGANFNEQVFATSSRIRG